MREVAANIGRFKMKSLLTVLGPALFAGVLCFVVALSGAAQTAEAGISTCRADPIVYLSDGTSITITVDIATDVTNVRSIVYAVHAPRGVKMLRVAYTPFAGFTGEESLTFLDDNPLNVFSTDTIVQTRYNNIAVVATTFLDKQSRAAKGLNAQHLKVSLSR